jgi:hypothetical protein
MRLFSRSWLPVLALVALAVSFAPARAQATVSVPDVFSYDIPAGWAREDIPNMYPAAVDLSGAASAAQAKAMISATSKASNAKLADWCKTEMARNQKQFATLGAQVGALEPFATTTGVNGFRASIDLTARGRALHYVLYFFDGGSGAKVTFTCACPAADVLRYAPIFEAAMKTFAAK